MATILPRARRGAPRSAGRAAPSALVHAVDRLHHLQRAARVLRESSSAPSRPSGSRSRRSRCPGTGTTCRCARRCPCRGAPGRRRRPTWSHRFAISFMKEMRVASIAFAAYLVSSAEPGPWSGWVAGAHEGRVELRHQRLAPAGRRRRPPRGRASGSRRRPRLPSGTPGSRRPRTGAVVRGHDDLAHARGRADRHRGLVDDDLVAVHGAADRLGDRQHVRRSAEPSSSCGVPTATKMMSLAWTPPAGRS